MALGQRQQISDLGVAGLAELVADRLSADVPHHPNYSTSATHKYANGRTCHEQNEPCCEHRGQHMFC